MHYADTAANDNGTATAFCYCGWSTECDSMESADTAAERHQNRDRDADSTAADGADGADD